MNELDKYTFGNYEAAIILAKLLSSERSRNRRKITCLIVDFNYTLRNLMTLDNSTIKKRLAYLSYKHSRNVCEKMSVSNEIKRFTHNVICANYRKYLSIMQKQF